MVSVLKEIVLKGNDSASRRPPARRSRAQRPAPPARSDRRRASRRRRSPPPRARASAARRASRRSRRGQTTARSDHRRSRRRLSFMGSLRPAATTGLPFGSNLNVTCAIHSVAIEPPRVSPHDGLMNSGSPALTDAWLHAHGLPSGRRFCGWHQECGPFKDGQMRLGPQRSHFEAFGRPLPMVAGSSCVSSP